MCEKRSKKKCRDNKNSWSKVSDVKDSTHGPKTLQFNSCNLHHLPPASVWIATCHVGRYEHIRNLQMKSPKDWGRLKKTTYAFKIKLEWTSSPYIATCKMTMFFVRMVRIQVFDGFCYKGISWQSQTLSCVPLVQIRWNTYKVQFTVPCTDLYVNHKLDRSKIHDNSNKHIWG